MCFHQQIPNEDTKTIDLPNQVKMFPGIVFFLAEKALVWIVSILNWCGIFANLRFIVRWFWGSQPEFCLKQPHSLTPESPPDSQTHRAETVKYGSKRVEKNGCRTQTWSQDSNLGCHSTKQIIMVRWSQFFRLITGIWHFIWQCRTTSLNHQYLLYFLTKHTWIPT